MMLTKRHETADGIFYYADEKRAVKNAGICITAYEGEAKTLFIPAQIDSYPVKAIGKKAFWGNRHLRRIILPDTVETIGDWAFSGCCGLEKITLPRKELSLGRQVFYRSRQLYEISIIGNSSTCDKLLAAAATVLEAEYLLTPLQTESRKWHHNLDARIMTVLREDEESALKNLVYCAEEDMGKKQEECLHELAKQKAAIALLRLSCPDMIEADVKQSLIQYLAERTKGCMDESAWEAVKECGREKLRYCDILFEIGGIHEKNIDAALDDLQEDNVELKAYLLKKWQDRQRTLPLWESLKWG